MFYVSSQEDVEEEIAADFFYPAGNSVRNVNKLVTAPSDLHTERTPFFLVRTNLFSKSVNGIQ